MEPLDLSLPTDFENPPPVISVELRRRLQRRYEAALRWAADPRQARAVQDLLGLCVATDPGNGLFARAWIAHLRRAGLANRWCAPWTPFRLRRALAAAALRGAQGVVLREALALLWLRPRETAALRALAQACRALGHTETRIVWLELAAELAAGRAPHGNAVHEELAAAYSAAGQFAAADEVRARPAERSPTAGGGDQAASRIAVSAPTDVVQAQQQLAAWITAGELPAAEALLRQVQGRFGGDLELRWLGEELELARARQRTEQARRQHAADGSADYGQLVADLAGEQLRIELGVWFARWERFPGDAQVQRELGLRLWRVGNYAEAWRYLEPLLDRAVEPPEPVAAGDEPLWAAWAEVVIAGGECQQRLRRYPQALAAYSRVANRLPLGTPVAATAGSLPSPWHEWALLSRYRAAVLATALGETGSARGWLTELAQLAPLYKDAAARLDKLPPICDKE